MFACICLPAPAFVGEATVNDKRATGRGRVGPTVGAARFHQPVDASAPLVLLLLADGGGRAAAAAAGRRRPVPALALLTLRLLTRRVTQHVQFLLASQMLRR